MHALWVHTRAPSWHPDLVQLMMTLKWSVILDKSVPQIVQGRTMDVCLAVAGVVLYQHDEAHEQQRLTLWAMI